MSGQSDTLQRILNEASSGIVKDTGSGGFPWISVEPSAVGRALKILSERAGLKTVPGLVGRDTGQEIELTYLLRFASGESAGVRVRLPRLGPSIASLSEAWPSLERHEQELAELLGVEFVGLTAERFLLPEDWLGNPLRKDYAFPENYRGVEHRRAPLRKEHQRP